MVFKAAVQFVGARVFHSNKSWHEKGGADIHNLIFSNLFGRKRVLHGDIKCQRLSKVPRTTTTKKRRLTRNVLRALLTTFSRSNRMLMKVLKMYVFTAQMVLINVWTCARAST